MSKPHPPSFAKRSKVRPEQRAAGWTVVLLVGAAALALALLITWLGR